MKFDKWAEHANDFVKEIARAMGAPEDTEKASLALRVVLHVLRDRLPLEEGLQLVAQLPMFIKALYLDGWRPNAARAKNIRRIDDLVEAMYVEDVQLMVRDFPDRDSAGRAARAVLGVIKAHVSTGEARDVAQTLPRDLRDMWDAA